jgi:hypothetical protein
MAKAEAKTKATQTSVRDYLDAIEDEDRRQDCEILVDLMQKATGFPPVMWGTGIVGFGSYHYRYASGHEGDSCLVGFSSRKGDISVYLMAGMDGQAALMEKLGKHKAGKGCLYLKRTSDLDLKVLAQMIKNAVAELHQRYPLTTHS